MATRAWHPAAAATCIKDLKAYGEVHSGSRSEWIFDWHWDNARSQVGFQCRSYVAASGAEEDLNQSVKRTPTTLFYIAYLWSFVAMREDNMIVKKLEMRVLGRKILEERPLSGMHVTPTRVLFVISPQLFREIRAIMKYLELWLFTR